MTDRLIPDGTYTIMGPGGQLTAPGNAMVMEPKGAKNQQWDVTFSSGAYTFRNAETGMYLGDDTDPNEPTMMVRSTSQPYPWQLSTGDDDNETTYILTNSGGLVLTMSLLRIYPPHLAILPKDQYGRTPEWTMTPV